MANELRAALETAITEDQVNVTPEHVESTGTVDVESTEHVSTESLGTGEEGAVGEEAGSDGGSPESIGSSPEGKVESGEGKPEAVATPYSKAPASWKGDAKEVWNALPEKARKEVTRRERQIQQTLNETAQVRQEYQAVQEVVRAYEPRLREWGVPAPEALRQFMDADRQLTTGPMVNRAQFMANLIKQYNIDFAALDAALAGQAPPADLNMEARIQQLVDQRMAPITQRFEQEAEQSRQTVVHTIQSMENNPEYPYFDDVRAEMADLIEFNYSKGVAVSLDDAYNRIVGWKGYAKPQSNNQAARRALGASVSVSGSPSTVTNGGNPADLRGTILKALEG